METSRFDRLTKHFTTAQWSRRASLRAGGAGILAAVLASAQALPKWADAGQVALAEDATPAAVATPANEVNLEGTWLCSQAYALCSMSACDVTPTDSQVATCPCTVEHGYSIGYATCADRAPVGQTIFSTFSTANVTSDVRAMACAESGVWANCLDMPCVINPDDPSRATCLCPLEESGDYFTFGGGCDITTCSTVIWSAADSSGNVFPAFQAGMKQVGEDAIMPQSCPDATPPAA
jgi:hypothetical protein